MAKNHNINNNTFKEGNNMEYLNIDLSEHFTEDELSLINAGLNSLLNMGDVFDPNTIERIEQLIEKIDGGS